jgi:hypothetical protein
MSLVFTIVEGDTSPSLRVRLESPKGVPKNLTGCTVELRLRRKEDPDELTEVFPMAIEGAPTDGVIVYEWQPGQTDNPGKYYAEFPVTFPSGEIQTWPRQGGRVVVIVRDGLLP